MNREQAKELLPIIQAFAEGKTIQAAGGRGWYDVDNINSNSCKYRIKPEPKYRPFKDIEECWQEMQKHKPFGWVKSKNDSIPSKFIPVLNLRDNEASILNICFTYSDLVKYYTFADGTPFGIKEE